jgi:hypothetical protein
MADAMAVKYTLQQTLEIAQAQKSALWCVVVQLSLLLICVTIALGFRDSRIAFSIMIGTLILCTGTGVVALIRFYRLASALGSPWPLIWAVSFVVPMAYPIVLLLIATEANRAIREHGFRVALLGANVEAIRKRLAAQPVLPVPNPATPSPSEVAGGSHPEPPPAHPPPLPPPPVASAPPSAPPIGRIAWFGLALPVVALGLCLAPICLGWRLWLDVQVGVGIVALPLFLAGAACSTIALREARVSGDSHIRRRAWAGIACGVAVVATTAATHVVVQWFLVSPRSNLVVRPPDGYVAWPEAKKEADVLYAYAKKDAGSEQPKFVLLVRDLGKPITREDVRTFLRSRPQASIFFERWRGYDLGVMKHVAEPADMGYVAFNAPVPVSPKALQLILYGPESDEDQMREDLRMVLRSLDGPTNW